MFYLTRCYLNWNSILQTFISLHNPVMINMDFSSRRDQFSQQAYWSCVQCPCRIFLGRSLLSSWAQGEENKMDTLAVILAPLARLPAERSSLYYCFSIRRISEAIFSFPDNLSRNIKDSLTTVNLQLILEWHSDVSPYSFILK